MLPRRQGAAVALTAVLLALLGASGRAQEAEPGDSFVFESIDVNVVNVEVYVTDKKGNRVTELRRDDFALFEDGKPVEITNFYAVEGGKPRLEPDSEPPDAAQPPLPVGPAAAAVELPEDQRLHLVIYFDNLFLGPANRNKVIDHTRAFLLDQLRDEDQIMLVTFERSVHVRHPFTTSKVAILEEMENLRTLSAFAPQQLSQRRELVRRLETARSAFEASGNVDFYAKSIHNDLMMSIRSLKEVVSSLAGLPGRKALLYVSDGLPMTPGEDLFFLIDEEYQTSVTSQLAASNYRARRHFNELTARANANRVSFYTLEAAGLTSHTSLSAEYGHRSTSMIDADVMRDANREEPLMLMAEATGGLSALNTNNLDGAFESIGNDFGNYYSLGYTPVHSTAGRYYKLEVKVKRPGVEVRHRSGYRDKTPENRVAEGALAALIHGAEKNSMGIELRFGAARPASKGNYSMPVEVRIPLARITLIQQAENHRGAVRLALAVIDDESRISPLHSVSLPIIVPTAGLARAREQEFIYEVELLMRRGIQGVAVGIRDDFAGDSAFIRRTVKVGR